jgi:hypothetical protein
VVALHDSSLTEASGRTELLSSRDAIPPEEETQDAAECMAVLSLSLQAVMQKNGSEVVRGGSIYKGRVPNMRSKESTGILSSI